MASEFVSKVLICKDCGEEFVITADALEYFAERGYKRDPKRCKSCFTTLKRKQKTQPSQPTRVTEVVSYNV